MNGADWLKRFTNEEQDPKVVGEVHARVSEILTSGEEVLYIAVQKRPLINLSPACVILTNKRFIVFRRSVLGNVVFEDHIWRELRDAQLRESILGAELMFATVNGRTVSVSYLPKIQARRLYAIAQEHEEKVREERRHRELEDKRAAAGGVVMHAPAPAPQAAPSNVDPLERLQKLKAMADAGLITVAEYQTKKAEILASM